MIFDEPKQVVCGDTTFFYDLSSDCVSCFDSFGSFSELLQVAPVPDRCGGCPDQLCIASLLRDRINCFTKPFSVLLLGIAPAVETIIEVNDGKPVMLQKQLHFLNE